MSVYLSHARRAGLIEQVAFKTFVHVEPEERPRLSQVALEVIDLLRPSLLPSALEQLSIWTDEDLAPFSHDAFVNPFIVIEGPRDVLRTIHDLVSPHEGVAMVPSIRRLGDALWSPRFPGARVFLVPVSRLEGTKPTTMGFNVPKLERLLAVVLTMPPLMPEAALTLMSRPEFRLSRAWHAIPSRRTAVVLGALLQWIREHQPSHLVLGQVEEEFGEWRW